MKIAYYFQEVASQRTDSDDDDLDEFTSHSEMPAPKTDNSSNQGNNHIIFYYFYIRLKLLLCIIEH